MLPLFTRGLARLPNHPKLLRELRLLERHTHRSGRDSVDHPRNGHDDHANSVAGVLRDMRDALGLGGLFEAISAQTAVVVICALVLFLINLAPMFGRGGPPPQSR